MAVDPLKLGPFTLTGPIGQGGMGVVFGGRHDGGEPVAVKVLARRVGDRAYQDLFEAEVRAVAALDHRNVVTVYEYGTVPAPVAAASRGALVLDAPYLVMEFLPDGSLAGLSREQTGWPRLQEILVSLLDALAHAHSHGVIHRDLKASNVLLAGDRVVLTDFGLAQAGSGQPGVDTHRSGTPSCMAPEQFAGAWRDFGPWTDLYALGVLSWRMVTGRLPFGARRSWTSAAAAHLYAPLPPLKPVSAVPEGFEDWASRLLAKDPGDRFGRAADARRALLALGPPRASRRRSAVAVDPEADTVSWPGQGEAPSPEPIAAPAPPSAPPSLPSRWPDAVGAPSWLRGAGLGLFGLRTLPLVDREPARDVLWAAAHEVLEGAGPRVVVLRGPAGTGKSRLAAWACQSLEEHGALQALAATHGPVPGPADGLGAMVGRWLRVRGLRRADVRHRCAAVLRRLGQTDPELSEALASLVLPPRSDEAVAVRLGTARARHQVLRALCSLLTNSGRPPVLWIDDVQWGLDALHGALHLAEGTSSMLLVLTAREEALAEQPVQAAALEALQGRPEVRVVQLGPLDEADRAELVGGLLGLGVSLAREVERRTAGNPLFAVQLVGDWVHRGLLVAGPEGFELADGALAPVPDDVHAVWTIPIEGLLASQPADDTVALELAALLGQTVDPDEWAACCEAAGVRPSPRLLESLVRRRLARADESGGWAFVHAMLAESLARRIDEGPDCQARHRAVATGLRRLGAEIGRIGEHWLQAGEHEQALQDLTRGASQKRRDQLAIDAERFLLGALQALAALGVPDEDPRALELAVLEAEIRMASNRLDEGADLAHAAYERALAADQPLWAARARINEAQRFLILREHADAVRLLGDALRLLRGADAPLLVARARSALAVVGMGSGRHEEARAQLARAREAYAAVGDAEGLGRCAMLEGATWEQGGDLQEARAAFLLALKHYGEVGTPIGRTAAHNGLAMTAMEEGDLPTARAHMDKALELARTYGGMPLDVLQMDAASIELADGRVDVARSLLEDTVRSLRAMGQKVRAIQCHGRLLDVVTRLGDRPAVLRCLDETEGLLVKTVTERHLALHLSAAGRQLVARRWLEEARRAWTLALHQWRGLKDGERTAEAETALRALDG